LDPYRKGIDIHTRERDREKTLRCASLKGSGKRAAGRAGHTDDMLVFGKY